MKPENKYKKVKSFRAHRLEMRIVVLHLKKYMGTS